MKNQTKEQKGGFLEMLLGSLGASLLGNLLTGKGIVRDGSGKRKGNKVIAKGQGRGIVRVGYGNEMDFQCPLIL